MPDNVIEIAVKASIDQATDAFKATSDAIESMADRSKLAGGELALFETILKDDAAAGIDLVQSLKDIAASTATVPPAVRDAASSFIEEAQAAQQASDALAGAVQAFDTVGGAAGGAAGHIHDAGQELEHAGESASEAAEGGFNEILEKLMNIGKGYVAVEVLKEFGTEALVAFGKAEQFVASMTLLTGSSERAETTLSALKAITASQPFALPDLLTSTQRLAAFGVEASELPGIMQAAANASAATGNSIDAISSALGRVEISGAVTARQLVQLGVSWQDIAKTMGVSVDEARARLKAGGQDAAADMQVLVDTVNTKFAGAGQALASTLLGQWQILKNQTDLIMEQIGESIAPALKSVMEEAESALIPAIKETVGAFSELLKAIEPALIDALKNVVDGVAGATEAIGHLIDWTRQAIGVISELSGLTESMKALGVEGKAQGEIWKDLNNPLGVYIGLIEKGINEIGSLTSELGQKFPAAAAAAADASSKFEGVTKRLSEQLVASAQAANTHKISIGNIGAAYEEQQAAVTVAQAYLKNVKEAMDDGRASAGQYAQALAGLKKAQDAMSGIKSTTGPDKGQEEELAAQQATDEKMIGFAKQRVEEEMRLEKALAESKIASIEDAHARTLATADLGVAQAQERFAALSAIDKQELDQTVAFLEAKRALIAGSSAKDQADRYKIDQEIIAAQAKTNAEIITLQDNVAIAKANLAKAEADTAREIADETGKTAGKALEAEVKDVEKYEAEILKSSEKGIEAQRKAQEVAEADARKHEDAMEAMERSRITEMASMGQITESQKLAMLEASYERQYAAELDLVNKEIALAKMKPDNAAEVQKLQDQIVSIMEIGRASCRERV